MNILDSSYRIEARVSVHPTHTVCEQTLTWNIYAELHEELVKINLNSINRKCLSPTNFICLV
jgi:hypothetical protein